MNISFKALWIRHKSGYTTKRRNSNFIFRPGILNRSDYKVLVKIDQPNVPFHWQYLRFLRFKVNIIKDIKLREIKSDLYRRSSSFRSKHQEEEILRRLRLNIQDYPHSRLIIKHILTECLSYVQPKPDWPNFCTITVVTWKEYLISLNPRQLDLTNWHTLPYWLYSTGSKI